MGRALIQHTRFVFKGLNTHKDAACSNVRSESRCALRLRYVDLVVNVEVAVEVCCCSVVKQRLKCNAGKVCNYFIQFLLTMVLSIEEHVFISAQ
jgi:hypothetical protein